jgi:hypothetical protein
VGAAEQARHDNHLLDRRDQAWRELQQHFLRRLRSGELVATGYEEPLSLGSERSPVSADVWRSLRPNFKNPTAAGAGLKLTGILVHTAEDAPAPGSSTDQISEGRRHRRPTGADVRSAATRAARAHDLSEAKVK